MIEVETRARKWGNSLGITLPKDVVSHEHITANQRVHILLIKQDDALRRTFGGVRWKKSAQQLKDQLRRELYA